MKYSVEAVVVTKYGVGVVESVRVTSYKDKETKELKDTVSYSVCGVSFHARQVETSYPVNEDEILGHIPYTKA